MATLRQGVQLHDRYTMIANDLFRRTDLSMNAKAIYGWMRSHRDGWEITTKIVADSLNVSESTVKRAVKELEMVGYVVREQKRTGAGSFASVDYTILAEPVTSDLEGNSTVGHMWPADAPSGDGAKAQVRTGGQNTDDGEMTHYKKTNIPLRKPKEENQATSPASGSVMSDQCADEFEAWYKLYPRHVGKQSAFKAWKRAIRSVEVDSLMECTLAFAEHHRRLRTEKRFIPHPTTWLNRGGWDDELDTGSDSRRSNGFLEMVRQQ